MERKRISVFVVFVIILSLLCPAFSAMAQQDYSDYIPGEKPANIFVRPASINSFTGNNGCAGQRLTYVSGDKFIPIKEKAVSSDTYFAAGPIFVTGSENITSGLVRGKSYVLSVTLKNTTPEIREEQVFAFFTGINQTPVKIPFYDSEYRTYNTVFTALADSTSLSFGLDATIDRSGYSAEELGTVHISMESGKEIYLAEETAHSMTLTCSKAVAEQGDSVEYRAELLNQIGIKGNLGQEFSWLVLNESRTDVIEEGFTISDSQDGIKIDVSQSAQPGKYVVLAESKVNADIKKGISLEVTEKLSYDDYIPAPKTDNIVLAPGSINSYTPNNGAAGSFEYDLDNQTYFTWREKAIGVQFYKAGPTILNSTKLSQSIENGEKYVLSVRLKNTSPDIKDSLDFALALYGDSVPVLKIPVTNTEYVTFNKTFTASRNSTAIAIGLDGTIDRSSYTQEDLGTITMDLTDGGSLYIAKEAPYGITNTILGADEITPGTSTTLKSQIVNQVGLPYESDQSISWTAMNENCTEVAEDIIITPRTNGEIFVTASDGAAYGTYFIVARSDSYGWVKKAKISVVDSVDERIADLSVVKLGNEILLNASVKDTQESKIYFYLAEYDGTKLVEVNNCSVIPKNGDATARVSLAGVSNENTVKAFVWGNNMKPIWNMYNYEREYSVSNLDSVYGDDQAIDMFDSPEVCTFYNDKKAAVSVTFDDGNYSAAVYYDSLFQRYNMHGTAMVVSDWIKNIDAWQKLLDNGTIDIGNHSKTHAIKYDEDQYTEEELEADITGSHNALAQMFPNEKIIVFATPWCRYTADAGAEILKNHYANRTGGSGFLSSNPTDEQMMKIPSYIIQSTQSIQTLNANIDKAIAEGKWYSLLMHGVNETNPETANNNINKDVCEAHFRYIGSKSDVWAGSMTEVIQYIKERNTANITINWIRENAMNLSLTDTLDDARFDFPLTYKVNVPSHWDSVKVTQNYNSVTVATQMVGDKNYVYINIIPDKGDVTLENIDI